MQEVSFISTYNQIQNELLAIDGGKFQKLCDAYLRQFPRYANLALTALRMISDFEVRSFLARRSSAWASSLMHHPALSLDRNSFEIYGEGVPPQCEGNL